MEIFEVEENSQANHGGYIGTPGCREEEEQDKCQAPHGVRVEFYKTHAVRILKDSTFKDIPDKEDRRNGNKNEFVYFLVVHFGSSTMGKQRYFVHLN